MPCNVIIRGIGILLIPLLVSCASTYQKLDPELFYRRDISLDINGTKYDGVAVVPYAKKYDIKLKPKADIDLLLITSCHREFSGEKLSPGWFSANEFRYVYAPVKGIEDTPGCPLRVNVYEKKKGRHSWSLISFKHPSLRLPIELTCNGAVSAHTGSSICQSKVGLIQQMRFDEPVTYYPDDGCGLPPLSAGNTIRFEIKSKECIYVFKGNTSGDLHQLITIGYSGVLVRETD